MTGIIRTWHCQNSRCGKSFDSWDSNPECPTCRCVRVAWVPGGGHIAGVARSADAELRALADVFKFTDMNSAEEGRGAKKVNLPPATAPNGGNVHTFAGGFSAAVNPNVGAQCVPAVNRIDYKVKAAPGSQLAPSAVFPGIRANTAVEARHKP